LIYNQKLVDWFLRGIIGFIASAAIMAGFPAGVYAEDPVNAGISRISVALEDWHMPVTAYNIAGCNYIPISDGMIIMNRISQSQDFDISSLEIILLSKSLAEINLPGDDAGYDGAVDKEVYGEGGSDCSNRVLTVNPRRISLDDLAGPNSMRCFSFQGIIYGNLRDIVAVYAQISLDWDGAARTVTIRSVQQPKPSAEIPVQTNSSTAGSIAMTGQDVANNDPPTSKTSLQSPISAIGPSKDSAVAGGSASAGDSVLNSDLVLTGDSVPAVGSSPANILIDPAKGAYSKDGSVLMGNVGPFYRAGPFGTCAWYAMNRLIEKTDVFSDSDEYRGFFTNGGWLDLAELKYPGKLKTIRDPNGVTDNSIAYYQGVKCPDHVLFVEHVARDPDGQPLFVYFTEANTKDDCVYHPGIDCIVKKLSMHDFLRRGGKESYQYVIGYITAARR